ncbi:hypothetical protein [Rhodococcus gannanensis]|uniref:Excreted virulence factor EspC, type VII ESX diderm n=1 Tax=Rhodococcus gannanensis TaxID=1960308 RepID=A0ABW4P455_9NOCA
MYRIDDVWVAVDGILGPGTGGLDQACSMIGVPVGGRNGHWGAHYAFVVIRSRATGGGSVTLYVDPVALESISSLLSESSAALDGLGSSAPGAISAGDATPALMGIIARLAANAGNLVVDLAAAGDAVRETNQSYREQDAESADALDSAWTD